MNNEIDRIVGSMQEKLLGNVTFLSYCYSQLCVKADGASLLQVTVMDNGLAKNIEDYVNVLVHDDEGDDDKLDLFPKGSPECLSIVSEGVFESYPEFKQSIEKIEVDRKTADALLRDARESMGVSAGDVDDIYFLRLVIPPVDDDRKDVLTKAVNAVHDAIKVKMDAVYAASIAEVMRNLIGCTASEIDETKKTVDELKASYEEMREEETEKKLKEIEDANKRYHLQHPEGDDTIGTANDWQKMKV